MSTMTFELYGNLGETFGKRFVIECSSVGEGLRILSANFKTFGKHIADSAKYLEGYEVWKGEQALANDPKDFDILTGSQETIKVIPIVKGASANMRIAVGVVLYAIGYVLNFTPFAWLSPAFYWAGSALIASGVAEKLAPKPKTTALSQSTESTSATSFMFSGPTNQIQQGATVPVGYGQMIVGSNVVSATVTTANIPVE